MVSVSHQPIAQAAIAAVESLRPGRYRASRVTGGSIHQCFHISDGQESYFVKIACEERAQEILQAEADGLRAIAATGTIRTPEVLLINQLPACFPDTSNLATDSPVKFSDCCCMVLEYLHIKDVTGGAALGHALADLHHCHGEYFGWSSDNFIGSTTQPNTSHSEISSFMAHERILSLIHI